MKIKRIHLNNYRAFLVNGDHEASLYTINIPNGENLLIYGENGSGKSSIFKALKDFLLSALNKKQTFQKNVFFEATKNSEQPFIEVEISDNSRHRFSADGNQYILMQSGSGGNTNYIKEANITNGFISYRDLLKLHFRPSKQAPDLISFFLGEDGLFTNMIVPAPANVANKVSFKALWEKCLQSNLEALTDYNTNVISLFEELEKKANMLLAFFQKECKLKIDYTAAKPIETHTSLHGIHPPALSFVVTFFEKEILRHDDFLNEARLTALAISVFLAHQLSRPETELRILFLDDIFIGLDMSNRLPLINILTADNLGDGASFKDFQIFMTTYDRDWFNVAKTYLGVGWQKIEFYVDSHSGPIERPLIRNSESYKDRAKIHFIKGDYPASANYLRKAFEQTLRNILPENILYAGLGGIETEVSQVTVSKQHLSMKDTELNWLFFPRASTGATGGSSLRPASLQNLIDMFKSLMNSYQIPFPYLEELTRIKNRLLNPLSHDDLRSPIFKTEVETGFRIFEELLKVKSKLIINLETVSPAYLYFDQTDSSGKEYRYKFQLLENLRYIEYKGIGKLLKAECKPISRQLKPDGVEEAGPAKIQRSVYDMCRGICIQLSGKKDIVLDENSLLNQILIETGHPLLTVI